MVGVRKTSALPPADRRGREGTARIGVSCGISLVIRRSVCDRRTSKGSQEKEEREEQRCRDSGGKKGKGGRSGMALFFLPSVETPFRS